MAEFCTMKQVIANPPNFAQVSKAFPECLNPKLVVFYCWGDTIYNPSGGIIHPYVAAHENVHRKQQMGGVEKWWEQYLTDLDFRLAQEIPAHRVEYQEFSVVHPNRNMRRVALRYIAGRLAGPLYHNMLTFEKAKRIVKEQIACS